MLSLTHTPIVVLTGVGVSAESGVPAFRGAENLAVQLPALSKPPILSGVTTLGACLYS